MRFIHGVVVTVVIEIAVCNELEKSFKVLKRPRGGAKEGHQITAKVVE